MYTLQNKRTKPGKSLARENLGLTLVELLIAVAIVGTIAAVAYPSYTQFTVRSNRTAAKTFVVDLANRQDERNMEGRPYESSVEALGFAKLPGKLAANYTVTVDADNRVVPPTYLVTATPLGEQLKNDAPCASLSIDQAGSREISGTGPAGKCW